MKRREFIAILGGVAASWPMGAGAQQADLPAVGFLRSTSLDQSRENVAAFRQGLQAAGYVDGRNINIEFRWAEGHDDQLQRLAAELGQRRVSVIVASATNAALAAKAVISAIPIVFAVQGDPIKLGLVSSLNRPNGNVTGVSYLTASLGPKRLGIIRELAPSATLIAALVNPHNPTSVTYVDDLQTAATALGLKSVVLNVTNEQDIEIGFSKLTQQGTGLVIVGADPLLTAWRSQVISSAARHAVPAIYPSREWAKAGALLSYGPDVADVYRHVGTYAARILKGMKPSDLPVEQPVKFELVINLKTAKALGLTIPPGILAIADEVIE